MKSFRIDENEMCSDENIQKAILKPSLGKRTRPDVLIVLENLESEIKNVQEMIFDHLYEPTRRDAVIINETNYLKERKIVKPNYKYDQIIHHVVVQSMREAIEHGMYEYVLGSIPGRGVHLGKEKIEKWIRTDVHNTRYVLKMDIRHFFQSVDHDILKTWLRRKIRNENILELCFVIIDAVEEGLPLGFYTSQWFANFLLQPLDHYIKEELHVKYMTRYMDDIVCFGANKRDLHKARLKIDEYLHQEFHLTMKANWQVFLLIDIRKTVVLECATINELHELRNSLNVARIRCEIQSHKGRTQIFINQLRVKRSRPKFDNIIKQFNVTLMDEINTEHGRPLDYMGFEFHRNKTILRESIMYRATKKARQISKQKYVNPRDSMSFLSSLGWVTHTDTYEMYQKRIKPYVDVKEQKQIVSKYQKRLNRIAQEHKDE